MLALPRIPCKHTRYHLPLSEIGEGSRLARSRALIRMHGRIQPTARNARPVLRDHTHLLHMPAQHPPAALQPASPAPCQPLANAQMAYTRTVLSSLPLTISGRGSHRCSVPSRPPETMRAVRDVGMDGWDGQRGEADSRAKCVRHEKRGSAGSCWYTTHFKSYEAEKKGRARDMARLGSDQCFRVIAVHG